MRILMLTTAALAAAAASSAWAETEVDELIVTRLPTDVDVITGARVIERAEIEARNTSFAADLLSTIPGVGIARTGAFGGVAAIRIRGASPDKTLVLVDGVPVGDPSDPSGAYDASSLQTADLERVEVLSGPQGSLWGSEAIGGVVSFTTRELQGVNAELEGGWFSTVRGFAGVGTADDRYAVNASVAGFSTDGISKAERGTEDDGFKTVTANAGARLTLSERVKLDGRLRYTRSAADVDGYAAPNFLLGDTRDRSKSRAWQGFARATVEALGLTHQLSASAYELHRDNLSAFPSSFDAERQVYRWTAARGDALVVGAERQESGAELSTGDSLELSNSGVFAVGRLTLDRLTLIVSARHDEPEAYKGKTTGRLSAALELGGGFSAAASAGTGFKTPTVSQAACDFCFAPPIPLKPERAEGYDLRVGWENEQIAFSVTAYRLLVRDQISFAVPGRYTNIAKTSSTGIEAQFDARLSDSLRMKLGYAWLDAIDRSTSRSLLRVPDHSGSAALFWKDGPLSAAVTVRGETSQSDTDYDGFSRVRRSGFVTADVAVAYAVNDQWSLTARVENLTDQRYQETFGYREPGTAAYVGVRFRN